MNEQVRVGVAVIVEKNGKILIGLRKSKTHGNGTWQFPGGHLEYKESFEVCAKREVKEETNLEVEDLQVVGVTNDYFEETGRHYVTIFVKANKVTGELINKEPHKCEEWKWIKKEELASLPNLFLPIKNLIKEGYEL
ncbi:MAG: NUDIX domain-containing protein [Candidatus Nanohaloarchaeota archaeon]|nr:NUDIX domain-containing protein [Candidatus Nanohaloarchaeota archaeon]